MKLFEEFQKDCNANFCNQKSIKSKNCLRESKQKSCFVKYISKLNNNKDYSRDIEFRNVVLKRDVTCRVWNALSNDERNYVLQNHYEEYIEQECYLEVMHIASRGNNPELKYDLNNVFLGSRYFHSLIDKYFDPVTRKNITAEERNQWFERIKKSNQN